MYVQQRDERFLQFVVLSGYVRWPVSSCVGIKSCSFDNNEDFQFLFSVADYIYCLNYGGRHNSGLVFRKL